MNRASNNSCFLGSMDGCVPGPELDAVGGAAGGCWRLSIAANITGDNINRPFCVDTCLLVGVSKR